MQICVPSVMCEVMLNTRYIIRPGAENQPTAQRNPGALGNAWLVDSIAFVPNPNAEINGLNGFSPGSTAIVNEEFRGYLDGLDPDPSGTISLTSYRPDDLGYHSNNAGEALAVFSEVWYDKGWQAYLDGQPVPHIRVDYILRALRLPPGEHDIRFVFEPRSFYAGRKISAISSSALILFLLALIGMGAYRNRAFLDEQPVPKAPVQPVVKRQPRKKKR